MPVGAASTAKFGGSPDGEYAYLTMRVLREERRQGVGTALHRRASEHAVVLGKSRFYVVVRARRRRLAGYYGARGYVELGRMQDVFLELADIEIRASVPDGISIDRGSP